MFIQLHTFTPPLRTPVYPSLQRNALPSLRFGDEDKWKKYDAEQQWLNGEQERAEQKNAQDEQAALSNFDKEPINPQQTKDIKDAEEERRIQSN